MGISKRFTVSFLLLAFTLPAHAEVYPDLALIDAQHAEKPLLEVPSPVPRPQIPTREEQIAQLHQEMLRMEQLQQQLSWPHLSRGPLLSFGDQHPQIPTLRDMLIHLGDLEQPLCEDRTNLFDIELHEALMRFQRRHGGKVDGILGPSTRRQLNMPLQARADQILLNIYRIQQFTPEGEHFVRVNVPDYRLHLISRGEEMLSMKTIVGKRKRKTPIFSTEINRVVVNPSWHVPKSIAYKDILPVFQENPDYLKKINIKVVSGWGKQAREIPADQIDLEKMYKGENYQRLWEPPGENNTLGKVKFLTTGPYAVYLHDTSARRLFEEQRRAFSSGCIRVEQPRQLADALLKAGNQWEVNQVDPLFSKQDTVQVNLKTPIKLYVTYWTSWVDEQGVIQFRDDLYRRDRYELGQLKQQTSQEILISSH